MTERRNGTRQYQYTKRRSGSERRGFIATPRESYDYIQEQQERSQRDRQTSLNRILRRYATRESPQTPELGNKDLPVFKHKNEILEKVEKNKAVAIGGPTGSGKSTQIPQYLYEAGFDKTYVLVPRRVIANGLYERLSEELTSQIGDEAEDVVGIIHGERVEHDGDSNKIIVMTPQTFCKMESHIRQEHGNDNVAVLIDEIHEANLNSEIAVGIAGSSVKEHDSWRLLALSATHDLKALTGPFNRVNSSNVLPEVNIDGRPHKLEVKQAPGRTAMDVYVEVGEDHEVAIIFTSGKNEIDAVIEKTKQGLDDHKKKSSNNVVFRKLHGELTETELAQINDPIPPDARLVVVSSPAGNSGITIPGATLVITDGTVNRKELDDEYAPGLIRRQASQAEITQQMGRAGRDVDGGVAYLVDPVVYRKDFIEDDSKNALRFMPIEKRKNHAPADIYSTQLGRTALEVFGINRSLGQINEFLPHSVEDSDISQAEELLERMGAINNDSITSIGKEMDQYALSPELSRGLVEAHRRGRPAMQLARIALISAAIEMGGLQDFSRNSNGEWKKLISNDVSDDYSAQLELFSQVGATKYGKDSTWMRMNDLHVKRVVEARKLTGKVLKSLGMDVDNIVLSPMVPDEREQIFRDMTSGMIDSVYARTGKNRQKQPLFSNIHGGPDATHRVISRRSSMDNKHELVAAMPRYYIDKNGQTQHIIELGFPVKSEEVAEFATENNALGVRMLKPMLQGDMVVDMEQPMFGSIEVGGPRVRTAAGDVVSLPSQELIFKELVNNPGKQQRALREIARQLEEYKKRLPGDELQKYIRKDHPPIITNESVDTMLREYASQSRSLSVIESMIRERIYTDRIGIGRYLVQTAIETIRDRTPDELTVDGFDHPLRIHYREGASPYTTSVRPRQYRRFNGPIYLPDGREVLVQIEKDGGRGVRQVSAAELMTDNA